MPFNLESFAGNPKEELSTLRYATKQDLRDLAAKCNIVVDPAYVKARLLSNILDYLINQEIIADDEEVQALRIAAGVLPPVPVDTEVEKIRLQLQLEKVKKETTERELYLEEKRAEAREKEREAEIRHQKKLQELSLSNRKEATLPATFEVFKASKLVLDFDERDPKVFFQNFEQIAETLKWPVEFWSLLIRNKVKGKAAFVASQLVSCTYCKKEGHTIENCPLPQCKTSKAKEGKNAQSRSTCHVTTPMEGLQPFEGFVCDVTVNGTSLKCLRDSGSSQSILADLGSKNLTYTREFVTISDLTSSRTLPLAEVEIVSPYFTGKAKVAVLKPSLPCSPVELILGNDLAGSQVKTNFIISDPDFVIQEESKSIESPPAITQVVTRNTSRAGHLKSESKTTGRTMEALDLVNVGKKEFTELQKEDPSLSELWKKVRIPDENPKLPYFYVNKGILCRHFRSPQINSNHTWRDCHQIVIPQPLRLSLLDLANSAESHLGVNKTYKRVSEDYYWPGLGKYIKSYVASCHHCQVTGQPNQRIPPAPLQNVLVPKTPFYKLIIDCVGPLPKTKRGNEYILTAMCPTSRYPLAFAIKNINAKTILLNLRKVFTVLGFPFELQCDQGTNFTSHVFKQTMHTLNIHNVNSSIYHPQTNGALERFHQTLKNLLRKYSSETANHWDEDLYLLMYVFRCTPHDSTGISPFEALFGRRPRTVLGMVKENILHQKPEETTNTLQYIKDLKSKFHQINDLVCSNLLSSQQVMQQQGNKKARLREFQKGDQVLLYHPIPGAPLREKFAGPYTVLDSLSKVNYVISTPDRRKDTQLVHVNLLKRYQSRVNSVPPRVTLVTTSTLRSKDDYPVVTTNEDPDEEPELISISDLTNSEIMGKLDSFLSHLSTNESKELNSLLTSFQDLCTDDPGTCNLIQHDILLEPGTQPIRQPFYRAIGKKLESLRSEVQYLIDHKLAVPSTSPWASPCILVPKANGKLRLCTDYRRLNKVTIKNSFPLPRINDILDNISNSMILTQIDLLEGYYQVKLTPKAQSISAFVTPFGLFEYVVMPFGLSNAPATFQRLMAEVIRDLPNVYVYLDDIVIANMTWEEHLQTLSKLFTRLRTVGLTINLAKSSFGQLFEKGDLSSRSNCP
ncbi:uncharacterized protein [Palaemon carinicauda]|uniref:uncharacterized protein n=1 Tax=Palaemon carinicauda TaxID=392227 RepID=UPI0035B60FAE